MHNHDISPWQHDHIFLGQHHARNERRVWFVVALTASMMIAEIVGGSLFGSMALIADGWHMSTHAAALSIAGLAYLYSRRHRNDPRFAFGTGKLGDLASFASATILAMIALLIGYESVERLFHPVAIAYDQAIPIAVIGLAVNLSSAWLLGDDHGHHHRHEAHEPAHLHDNEHHHEHHAQGRRDLNLRAAYVHVLADAAVSVLAIIGLLVARLFGWAFMDPVVGLVGMIVILSWAFGLVWEAGGVLLDLAPDQRLLASIRARLERGGDRVTDLHVWRVGTGHFAAVISLVSDAPHAPDSYKSMLASLGGLSHVTVEVHPCRNLTEAA
jgi:cation diffusion facilitator family transporter